MIASFSDAGYLMRRRPHPRSCSFEKPQFQRLFGHHLFQIASFTSQVFDFGGRRRTCGITGKALLAGFEELSRPAVIQALGNALTTAQFGKAVLDF